MRRRGRERRERKRQGEGIAFQGASQPSVVEDLAKHGLAHAALPFSEPLYFLVRP